MNFVGKKYNYYLTPDVGESNNDFYTRGWIIAKMQPVTEEDFSEANIYAKLWCNHLHGCQYNKSTEILLEQWRSTYNI